MYKIGSAISLVILLINSVCYGQSNIGVSSSGFLTSLPPGIPTSVSPSDMASDIPLSESLTWRSQIHTASYSIEISLESDFSVLVIDLSGLIDTMYSISGLENSTSYFWRVLATNVAGESEYSAVRSFTTIKALPEAPVLAEPVNNSLNIAIDTVLKWNSISTAESYSLQISTLSDFSTLVADQSNLMDTTFSVSGLENNTTYYWHVMATNVAGDGSYSEIWNFTTAPVTSIGWDIRLTENTGLEPAYPNPFNDKTTLKFRLPEDGKILLSVYNIMGQSVRELVSEHMPAGEYSVTWDGSDQLGISVKSGLYICILKTQYNVYSKKILRK